MRLFVFCIYLLSFSLHSKAQVTANFSAPNYEGCSPFILKLTDQSTGSISSWQWTSTAGISSNKQNPTLIFPNAGVYDITLTVSDGVATDSKTTSIRVLPGLQADFTVTQAKGCAPLSTGFYDLSVPQSSTITNWFWSFGNGETSTAQNPSTNYNLPGNYDVLLKITDNNGCASTIIKEKAVSVDAPVADFLFDSITCTVPATINFLNTSIGKDLNYQWDFGNGNTSTKQFPNAQNYPTFDTIPIQLIVSEKGSICADTVVRNLKIQDYQVNFDLSVECFDTNFRVTVVDKTVPTPRSLLWDFGDGSDAITSTASHTYINKSPRTIVLTASASGNCSNSKSFTYTPTKASFDIDAPANCNKPYLVNFTNQSEGAGLSYLWTFADTVFATSKDTSFAYSIPPIVNYPKLAVIDSFQCMDMILGQIEIPYPKAGIKTKNEITSGCSPLTINFLDTLYSTQTITSYLWDFGDGNTSTAQKPTHTYTSVGKYDVQLTVQQANGCSDTILLQEYISVGELPLSTGFDVLNNDTICFGEKLSFVPNNVYSQATYKSDYHCWLFEKNDAAPILLSSEEAPIDCPPLPSGYLPFDTIVHSQNPTHEFSNSKYVNGSNYMGMYYIGETQGKTGVLYNHLISGFNGCYTEHVKPVVVQPTIASIGFSFKDLNFTLVECDSAKTIGIYNASLNYDSLVYFHVIYEPLNDTVLKIGKKDTVTYHFNQAGTYSIEIEVYNKATQCSNVSKKKFRVINYDLSYSSPATVCKGDQFTLIEDPTTLPYLVDIREWWLNGSNISAEAFPEVSNDTILSNAGDFGWNVIDLRKTLRINDELLGNTKVQKSCFYQYVDSIFIEGTPITLKLDSNVVCGNEVSVVFSETFPASPILSYQWSVNDTLLLNGPIDSVQFQSSVPGYYRFKLKTVSQFGCTDSAFSDSLLVSQPQMAFEASDTVICKGDIINFKNWTVANNATFKWKIEGIEYNNIDAIHQFNNLGNFDIKLLGRDQYGCEDSLTKIGYINASGFPIAAFKAIELIANCPPYSIQFLDTSSSPGTSWEWSISDGNTANTKNFLNTFISAGSYDVQLITRNDVGCTDTLLKPDYIVIKGPNASFSMREDTICNPDSVRFDMLFKDAAYYVWEFGDNIIESGAVTNDTDYNAHLFTKGDLYYPLLTVIDSNDCSVKIANNQPLYVEELIADFSGLTPTSCSVDSVLFVNSTSTAFGANYSWDFGNGATSNDSVGIHSFASEGNYNIKLKAVSVVGCKDSASLNYNVFLAPKEELIHSTNEFCVPVNMLYKLQFGNSSFVPDYVEFTFNGTKQIGDSVVRTVIDTGTIQVSYHIEYAGGVCKIDSAFSHTYYNHPVAAFTASPKAVALTNPEVEFTNLSTDATIFNWFLGDGTQLQNKDFKYEYSTTGNLNVKLIANNGGNCPDSVSHIVSVAPTDIIQLPAAFSPNGDGLNDVFRVLFAGDVTVVSFEIYNRWGNLVFRTRDVEEGWDGNYNGKPQGADTYVYYVRGRTTDNDIVEYKGNFALIR